MITLHHLNASRSIRILWLLEEIGQPYELITYQRDSKTHLAPATLKAIHPLGKSPVIELDGKVIAESGAIVELLIKRLAPHLAPDEDSEHYSDYLQWIHFAESSLMLPLLLELFTTKAGVGDNEFLAGYISAEKHKVLSYLNDEVKDKAFIIGNKLSGADFMLAFDLIMLVHRGALQDYMHIKQYALQLASIDSYQRAMRLEANYDDSIKR